MHIAASIMTVMARPSCTTVHLFGASHCHVLPLRPALPWGCGPLVGGGGPSLGDHPPGGGGGPSSLGWGTTRGGEGKGKLSKAQALIEASAGCEVQAVAGA